MTATCNAYLATAIVARWDDVADRMIERSKGIASRLVIYLTSPG